MLSQSGTYTLDLQNTSNADSLGYRFKLLDIDHGAANALILGSDVMGSLTESGQRHFYTFSGAVGQRLFFDGMAADRYDLWIGLLAPDGRPVAGLDAVNEYVQEDYGPLRPRSNRHLYAGRRRSGPGNRRLSLPTARPVRRVGFAKQYGGRRNAVARHTRHLAPSAATAGQRYY